MLSEIFMLWNLGQENDPTSQLKLANVLFLKGLEEGGKCETCHCGMWIRLIIMSDDLIFAAMAIEAKKRSRNTYVTTVLCF